VGGGFEGTNAFGGSIEAVTIMAASVEKTDATAAASMPLREVGVGAASEQHGIVVRLERVQYAPEETRVFVTVINTSSNTASFYDFNAKATRGSEQFDAGFSFTDYPEVQSEVLPAITTSGVVVFPPMEPNAPTRFLFEARSDDYLVDFSPYVFDVPGA
jgi:hypothetical protein